MSMSVTRPIAAFLGTVAALSTAPNLVQTDSEPSTSWFAWALGRSSDQIEGVPQKPKLTPGIVVAWGEGFGRSPKILSLDGKRITKAAANRGFGVAVDESGNAFGFTMGNDNEEHLEQITKKRSIVDIAIRRSARELVLVDSAGHVLTSQLNSNSTFQPAEELKGAIRRSPVSNVKCGNEHCIALTKRGEAYSWGSQNKMGELGLGTVGHNEDSSPQVPARVNLPNGVKIKDAACGNFHSLFLGDDGNVYGVGNDKWAQLGISSEPWSKLHEQFSGTIRKSRLVEDLMTEAVAGGGNHSVMLVRDGTVFSFGFNQWGQLGHHNYSSLAPPSPIANYEIRAIDISAGENHTCILKDNGEMSCIGGNEEGQLGTGNLQPSMKWRNIRVKNKAIKPSFVHLSGNTTVAVVPPEELFAT